MQIAPYLSFDGRCAEAFRHYETVLGGRIEALMTYGETPACGELPADWHGKVIHACLLVGGQRLMGGDPPPQMMQAPQGMSVSLHVEDAAEAERIFAGLAEGGATVTMPLAETFWAIRFGMLIDRFGIPWMVNCSRPEG